MLQPFFANIQIYRFPKPVTGVDSVHRYISAGVLRTSMDVLRRLTKEEVLQKNFELPDINRGYYSCMYPAAWAIFVGI